MSRALVRALAAIAAFVITGLVIVLGPYGALKERLGARPPFEELPARGVDDARSTLESLGEDGRALYRRQLVVDLAVVAANAAWLWIWLRATARRTLPRRPAVALPIVLASIPALADLAENIALNSLISGHPSISEGLVRTASLATSVKLASFMLAVGTALALSVWVLVKRLRRAPRAAAGST